MIFQVAADEAGPPLGYLGCGVGHQPRAAHELPTPTRSPTIAFTAGGPGDGVVTPPTPRPTIRAAALSGRAEDRNAKTA
jgi:hypothetical protein